MVVRIGTAGIPIQCKGGSTLDGVECVSRLGLSALEIEFVRNVYLSVPAAREVGALAKRLDVALSVHAPYYVNLAALNDDILAKSRKYVSDSLEVADACGASVVVVHAGFYMGRSSADTVSLMKKEMAEFSGFRAKVGVETMGRQKQFGTVDEVFELASSCDNVCPVVDFAHIHARGNGCVRTKDDFKAILDRFEGLCSSPLHCHMTGIFYSNGNEKYHLPISSNEPDFRLLAELVRENGYSLNVICESPMIESDALLFKKWIEHS